MKEITHKVIMFWKMADEQERLEEAEHHYKDVVGRLPRILNSDTVIKFIRHNQDEPFFKIDDFTAPLPWLTNSGGPRILMRYLLQQGIHKDLIKQILTSYIKSYHLQKIDIGVSEYLDIEEAREYLPQEVLEKAQRKVILHLMKNVRWLEKIKLMPEETEKEKQDKEKKYSMEMGTLRAELDHLMSSSKRFPKEFIDELGKRFGLDFYLNWRMTKSQKDNTKKQLDTHDVALIIQQQMLTNTKLGDLMMKATEDAKSYMRGLLWTGPDINFILDSEDLPINSDMKKIEWPEYFWGRRISKEIAKARSNKETNYENNLQKWWQLIVDFGGIPQ